MPRRPRDGTAHLLEEERKAAAEHVPDQPKDQER